MAPKAKGVAKAKPKPKAKGKAAAGPRVRMRVRRPAAAAQAVLRRPARRIREEGDPWDKGEEVELHTVPLTELHWQLVECCSRELVSDTAVQSVGFVSRVYPSATCQQLQPLSSAIPTIPVVASATPSHAW